MTSPKALALCVVLAATACDEIERAPSAPPPNADRDVVVTEGAIVYKGKPLALGEPVAAWKESLGAPSRQNDLRAVWDALGLEAMVTGTPPVVNALRVYFEPMNVVTPWEPKQGFLGTVTIDGAAAYRGVKIRFVNAQLKSTCKHFDPGQMPGVYECSTATYAYSLGVQQMPRTDTVRFVSVSKR